MQTSSNTTPTSSLYTEMGLSDVKNDSTSNKTTNGPPPGLEHIEPTPQNNKRSFRESEGQESKELYLDVCETESCGSFRESEGQESKELYLDVCETESCGSSASALRQRTIQQALKDRSAAAATAPMVGMDAANAKATQILLEEGSRSAVKHMFTRADGSTRSYSEMRSLYG